MYISGWVPRGKKEPLLCVHYVRNRGVTFWQKCILKAKCAINMQQIIFLTFLTCMFLNSQLFISNLNHNCTSVCQ